MKVLEVDRASSPATSAWSPIPQHPALIAAGTVAGTMSLDFDTSAHLEILSLDLASKEPKVLGKTSATDRFHKLVWGLTGVGSETYPYGVLVGGLANGSVSIWDPAKIISGKGEESLIASCERHASGTPVQGLDFNPFQHNLLASGGADSEIFIWDLQNTASPTVYNPGAKTHNQDAVTCVAWNRKVQHILGSTNSHGVTVVWDLKAKRSVLNFSDPNKKIRCRSMAWNPEEATQLVTASEDDGTPVIALWDLRNTYSPARYLEGHTGGIWALSWCPMDNDLLLSTGKDNKTLCWNVKTGQILSEVDLHSGTWNFDVQWSPRIPTVLSTTSLEGKIKIFSLQDLRPEESSLVPNQTEAVAHAPKWMKRPVGAVFGFGGKLYSFKKPKLNEPYRFRIRQTVTEEEILIRADKLEEALNGNLLKEFCEQKIAESSDEDEKTTWSLLRVLFDENQRRHILQYLGYNSETIAQEIEKLLPKKRSEEKKEEETKEETKEEIKEESNGEVKEDSKEGEEVKESSEEKSETNDVSGLFSGQSQEFAFALAQQTGGGAAKPVLSPSVKKDIKLVRFIAEDGPEGTITRALLVGNFEAAVDVCILNDRLADALILAAYGGPELWNKTQEVYFQRETKPFMRLVSYIVKDELRDLVEQTDLKQWKAILAILCTYAKREDFAILSGFLGDRLFAEQKDAKSATLCYICAGNIENTVQMWVAGSGQSNLTKLQNLIEKVTILRQAIRHQQALPEILAGKYGEYAEILASQGRVSGAIHTLNFLTETKYEDTTQSPFVLLDRLFHSQKATKGNPPPFPFKREEVAVQPQPALKQVQRPQTSQPAQKPFTPPPMNQQHGQPQVQPQRPQSLGQPPLGQPPLGQPPLGQFSSAQSVKPVAMQSTFGQPSVGQPSVGQLQGQTTLGQSSLGQAPLGQLPLGQSPFGQLPLGQAPLGQAPLGQAPLGQVPLGQAPLGQPPLGQVPLNLSVAPPLGAPPMGATGVRQTSPRTQPNQAVQKEEVKVAAKPEVKAQPKSAQKGPTTQENQHIIDSLNSFISTATRSQDPKVQKLAKDVSQRFKPLFDKLEANESSQGVVHSLGELVQAISSGDSRAAQNVHQTLTTNNWEELGSGLMIGIKRLIEMSKQ